MAWVGGAALGIFGIEVSEATGSFSDLAIALGYIAATIEVV